jgi:hypothetical protein
MYKEIILDKGENKYIFRYRFGEEQKIFDAMGECAEDPRTDFDWFDAAVLSYNVNRRLSEELDNVEKDLGLK